MTNKEAFELLSKEREFSNLTGWSFVRILSINFDTIKKEYDLAKKYLEPSEELKNLMHKKNAILYKYAEKNENGEPIVIEVDNNKQYKLTSDNESKALEEIKELEKEGLLQANYSTVELDTEAIKNYQLQNGLYTKEERQKASSWYRFL